MLLELEDIRKHVGSRILLFRERMGFTQESLGKQCGLTRNAIRALEAGRAWPRYGNLTSIAALLGVEVEDLFAGVDHKPIKPTPAEALKVLQEALAAPLPTLTPARARLLAAATAFDDLEVERLAADLEKRAAAERAPGALGVKKKNRKVPDKLKKV